MVNDLFMETASKPSSGRPAVNTTQPCSLILIPLALGSLFLRQQLRKMILDCRVEFAAGADRGSCCQEVSRQGTTFKLILALYGSNLDRTDA